MPSINGSFEPKGSSSRRHVESCVHLGLEIMARGFNEVADALAKHGLWRNANFLAWL
ncbi:hypothetical protein BVRB_4g080170 [Beta vulgaris subsp. vulgaris]|nr:hypothetical protein BVRB_4g080170 [Beta vulgaris subsp. vulgaris]